MGKATRNFNFNLEYKILEIRDKSKELIKLVDILGIA